MAFVYLLPCWSQDQSSFEQKVTCRSACHTEANHAKPPALPQRWLVLLLYYQTMELLTHGEALGVLFITTKLKSLKGNVLLPEINCVCLTELHNDGEVLGIHMQKYVLFKAHDKKMYICNRSTATVNACRMQVLTDLAYPWHFMYTSITQLAI